MGDLVTEARQEADPDKARQIARMAGVASARETMPGPCPFGPDHLPLAVAWVEGALFMLRERLRRLTRVRPVALKPPRGGGYVHRSVRED